MSVRDTRQPLVSAPTPVRRSRWRFVKPLLVLAVLGPVAGMGVVGFEQLSDARESVAALETRLQGLSGDQQVQLENDRSTATQLQAAIDDIQKLKATLGGDQRRQWQMTEVSYYVRMAQQHLALTQDAHGSRSLLDVADRVLADSQDPDLLQLRRAIIADEQKLDEAGKLDVPGLYMQLNSVDQQLATLVLPMEAGGRREQGVVQQPEAPAPVAASGWRERAGELVSQGAAKFRSLIVVRHYDEPIKPLLSDAQRNLVTQNLRVHLGQAELALLRGDDRIYAESLKTVQADFARYFQMLPGPKFNEIQSQLLALSQVSVQPAMPELGSVAALKLVEPLMNSTSAPAATASSGARQ